MPWYDVTEVGPKRYKLASEDVEITDEMLQQAIDAFKGSMPVESIEQPGKKVAMPIHRTDLPEALYHATQPDRVDSILRDGLHPWDDERNEFGTNYDNEYEYDAEQMHLRPRPNHAYLANRGRAEIYGTPWITARTRDLDPEAINADEDHLIFPDKIRHLGLPDFLFDDCPDLNTRHHFGGEAEYDDDYDGPDNWWEDPERHSRGDWADKRADYFDHPDVVSDTYRRGGSVAHQGTVPSSALELTQSLRPEKYQELERIYGTDWLRRHLPEDHRYWKTERPEVGESVMERRKRSLASAANTHPRKFFTLPKIAVKTANILDPVKDGLDPDVFDDPKSAKPKLKPELADWVTNTVLQTMAENGWEKPDEYVRLVLTGSLTTYQYSPDSDFDVSLWIDGTKLPEWQRSDLIALMVSKLDGELVPGTTHPLQCYVVPREIKSSELYAPGLRSAFDLAKGEWIVPPEKERVHDVYAEWPYYISMAKMAADKLRILLKYNPDEAKEYFHELHEKRRSDMIAGKGDYEASNITWKWIENQGLDKEVATA